MSVPSSVPSRPTGSTRPSGWMTSGSGWPPHARSTLHPPVAEPQVRVGDRAEAAVAALLAQRLVQQREHAARAALVGRAGAQRVAGERGDRGGVGALALHVADQRRVGAAARLVEVVEVAAELDALAGRAEAHGRRQPGDLGQGARPQRALERLGDRALALVQLRVGDRDRGELGELREDRVVALGELALVAVERPRACRARCRGRSAARRSGRARPRRPTGCVGDVAVSGRSRGSGAKIATVERVPPISVAGGVDRELEDLLDGQRRVERHRDVGQRAQLLDVLVLDPGDLADLAVAAVDALEDRQALAQEVGGRLQRRLRRPAAVPSAARSAAWCASARSSTLRCAATAWRPRSYAAPSSRSPRSAR